MEFHFVDLWVPIGVHLQFTLVYFSLLLFFIYL